MQECTAEEVRAINQHILDIYDNSSETASNEDVRHDLLIFAKQQRIDRRKWPAESAKLLGEVLLRLDAHGRNEFDDLGKDLDFNAMLRQDKFQHVCDLRLFIRIAGGYLFVFACCHSPWIIALFIVYEEFTRNRSSFENANPPYDQNALAACEQA